MKKSDLRSGMMVETRDDNLYLVVGDFITRGFGFDLLLNYHENMLSDRARIHDIMKVYEFKNDAYNNNATSIEVLFNTERLTLLWERKERNLTKREFEVLEALHTLGYEWLARDEDGELFAYCLKPKKTKLVWWSEFYMTTLVNANLFTFIKWEDDEPVSIKELFG